MITSISNTQIKLLVKLMKKPKVRQERRLFVVEGIKMTAEAISFGQVKRIYATKSGLAALQERQKETITCPVELITEQVLMEISDTVSPQGVLSLVEMLSYDLDHMLFQQNANLLFLEEIRDPGNLGTLIRTAECAGVSGIILSSGCVDIYNPKTIRATMGAVFRVPFVYTSQFLQAMEYAKKQNIRIFGTHLEGKRNFFEEDYRGKTAFVIGNEANGITKETARAADVLVKIPMEGNSESLNASVAAAIIMYESYRQKWIDRNVFDANRK